MSTEKMGGRGNGHLNKTDPSAAGIVAGNPNEQRKGGHVASGGRRPVTAGRLGELTGLTTGAVTGIIDRLEQAGFVLREKDPHDRRRVIVKPVKEKIEQFEKMFDSLFQTTIDIVQRYSDQEIDVILDFIKKFNAVSLEEMNRMKERTPRPETESM